MDNIPDPILVEIFKFLDRESLEVASKISQRWNAVIDTCSSLMHKLRLHLIIQQATSVDDAFQDSKRLRYRRLIFRSTQEEITRTRKSQLKAIIDNSFVQDLSLIYLPLSLQNSILSSLPNITTLYVDSNYVHERHHTIFNLPHLKEVDCVRSDFILHCIGQHRIEKLTISFISSDLFEFFERCSDLKELTIWGFKMKDDREFKNFQLEILRLEAGASYNVMLEGVNWNLKSGRKFLESQRRSLRKFYVAYCDFMDPCNELLIYALNNMTLTTLHAYYPIVYGNVEKLNEEMKDLKLEFHHSKITENIIASCPMVEKIDLTFSRRTFQFMLPLVSKHMPFLKYMRLSIDYPEEIDFDAKFDKLETLDVKLSHENEIGHFINLVRCCPQLKFIKIYMPLIFRWNPRDLAVFLSVIPNVVEIQSFENFGLDRDVVQLIMDLENGLKLRNLKIYVEDPQNFSNFTRKYRNSKLNLMIMQRYPYH